MQREMRKAERQLTLEEAQRILDVGEYGILSLQGEDGYAYGVPLSYVYKEDAIYFHCASEGKKLDCLAQNDRVSFCVVGKTEVLPEKFSTKYESAIVFGSASRVAGAEKDAALLALLEKYSPDFIAPGRDYIAKAKERTVVIRIEVEKISGKARR